MKFAQFALFFSLFLVVFSGCSKEQRNNRRIDGQWNVVALSVVSPQGMKTHPSCQGKINFTTQGKRSKKGTYHFDIAVFHPDTTIYLHEQGNYSVENKTELKFIAHQETSVFKFGNIDYSTKQDIVLYLSTKWSHRYLFTLKRQL